jgi:serine protease
MSGEAFAVRLERRVDLHEGELALGRLRMDPEVESAELDVIDRALLTPNDPRFPMQWNLSNPTAGIRATQAWDLTTGSANTVVAVVDTGELLHPEFASRLLQGADMITDPARARDGTARDNDPTDAGDFKTAGLCAAGDPADDSSWHGTFVMGIIGATGNDGQGIAGIDWRARLIQVRVLGRCGGTRSDILDGLRWAVGIAVPGVATNANPARVVNMSLGGPGSCDTAEAYQLAIIDALVRRATVVVAAGNENESALASVPASCVGAITVAATGPTGDKAFYSNYSRAIEIAAPGGDSTRGLQVWSTSATGLQGTPGNATYKEEQGTSFAAPHVAGVVSLMLGVAPSLTVAQVRDTVIASSSAFPAGSSCAALGDCGAGIVNAFEAVRLATALGAQPYNLSALWWQPTENGWGINFQQQGNVIFGTWFTYDLAGRDLWLVMPSMTRVTEDFFLGDVFETTGVPFNQINGQPSARTVTKVGTAVLAFLGITEGIFAFDISGTSGGHAIERQVFSTQAICTFTTGSRTALTNYQDLWWNPAETGWGVNITHQGNTIFATWFTYAPDGEAMWLVGPSLTRAGAAYTGELYRATGVPFSQINGAAAIRTLTSVGTMTLTFQNGEQGRMDYVVNGTNGSKQITRQVFSSPLSTCR